MIDYPLLRSEIAQHPYPLLFATISGAHLYGFPSPDSDYDLRGQLYSPLVVQGGPSFDELRAIGLNCITRHHVHHYLGFAATQWSLFQKESLPRVKPLLYVYRVLLTGIHLMRTGVVEASLSILNEEFGLPYVDELITLKTGSKEQATLDTAGLDLHAAEYQRLRAVLEESGAHSKLREEPDALNSLNDLLVRLRLLQC